MRKTSPVTALDPSHLSRSRAQVSRSVVIILSKKQKPVFVSVIPPNSPVELLLIPQRKFRNDRVIQRGLKQAASLATEKNKGLCCISYISCLEFRDGRSSSGLTLAGLDEAEAV